jgi:hypothetical protein
MARARTRLTLFYVLGYLTTAAIGLLVMPGFTQRMLFGNVEYDAIPMRFAGVFILGLAILVAQIIRLRLDTLYPTLVMVRVVFCAIYIAMYVQTGNPFFLAVLAIVGLGLVASSVAYVIDGKLG